MAKLSKAARGAIPTDKFALPGRRFPIEDRNHAEAAKMSTKNLSPAEKATVDRKANKVLGMSDHAKAVKGLMKTKQY